MGKIDVTDRLAFLAEKFDIFETEDVESIKVKCDEYIDSGWKTSEPCKGNRGNIIGILTRKDNVRGFPIFKVSISYDVFTSMIGADPTENKMFLQWMLNTFSKLLKNGEFVEAARFAEEDLPQANEYLILFEANKRKKKFREMAQYSLKGFTDITNINEYKNLGQLFDAIDPFIERNPSELESIMKRYVDMGQALIPFKDRRYTIFIPLSTDANAIFNNFAGWCTARIGNGMWKNYTETNKKPNGENSTIYIVIDNGFFNGENENIYQIHFETRQIKDRSNSNNVDLYDLVLSNSDGIRNYFGEELMKMAKDFKNGFDSNYYIDILIDFGFTEALFDFFDSETPIIKIDSETSTKKRCVPKLPDLSRFTQIKHLVIMDSSLSELHPSIGSLNSLRMISLCGNKIKELPNEIGQLSNLIFLNLVGNPITVIPDNIKYLDESMGGNLKKIAIKKEDISEANYRKLVELLPNVKF